MSRPFQFPVSDRAGKVSALLDRPRAARALLVMGHGAGAGMHHVFMEALAKALRTCGIATLRYQFPYMEQGRKRPDHRTRLCNTVRQAVAAARAHTHGLPLFAGGKSMGGRMTSLATAGEPLPDVRGLVFFGYPLHPARNPGVERAAHWPDINVPTLFLQGDRDALAELSLLRSVLPTARRSALHVIEGADHGFHVLKRSGRTHDEVIAELAETARAWMERELFGS